MSLFHKSVSFILRLRKVKALVFAAGLGTRLKPFTLEHPKALVPVGGVPMLGRVITNLCDAGMTEVVVNVHHFADQIIDYLNKNDFGIEISISDERDLLLDTGGGILKARRFLDTDKPFIVHNADILTDVDLAAMYDCHIRSGAEATLLTMERETSRYLYFDRTDNRLAGWENRKTGERLPVGFNPDSGLKALAFGGIHVLSPSVFKRLENFSDTPVFSIIPFYVSEIGTTDIRAYVPSSDFTWIDVGKPESLRRADAMFSNM